jgi:hypothetical protein
MLFEVVGASLKTCALGDKLVNVSGEEQLADTNESTQPLDANLSDCLGKEIITDSVCLSLHVNREVCFRFLHLIQLSGNMTNMIEMVNKQELNTI